MSVFDLGFGPNSTGGISANVPPSSSKSRIRCANREAAQAAMLPTRSSKNVFTDSPAFVSSFSIIPIFCLSKCPKVVTAILPYVNTEPNASVSSTPNSPSSASIIA